MTNPPPKTKLWIKILLLTSLGLNLAIIGVLAGLAGKPSGPPRNIRAQDIVAALSFALPDERRREMRRTLTAHRRELASVHGPIVEIRREFIEALSGDPFDVDAFEQLLAQERDHFVSLGQLAYETLLGIVSEMSVEERQAFVNRLNRPPPRR